MKRNTRYTIAALAALSLPTVAWAQPSDFTTLARSLVLGSASTDLLLVDADARRAALSTDGNLPDPTVEGEFLVPQTSGESNRWGVSADWSLEWPGVYGARREQARLEGEAVRAGSDAALERRVQEVQTILVDIQAGSHTWTLLKRMLADTDSLSAVTDRASRGGEVSRIDVGKLRVERARLAARMEQVSADLYALQSTLARDYGIRPDDIPDDLQCPPLPLRSLDYYIARYDSLGQSAQYRAATRAAEASVKVARREALPGIGIGYRHAFEDANHFNGAAISLSVPLFSSRGKKKAAELRAFTAASEERVARQNWSENIRNTYTLAERLDRQIKEIQAAVSEGYDADLLRRAYEGGEWSLVEYLQERVYYLDARLDLIDLERAYNQAVTLLQGF